MIIVMEMRAKKCRVFRIRLWANSPVLRGGIHSTPAPPIHEPPHHALFGERLARRSGALQSAGGGRAL